jgi:hypothetical protein
MKRTCIVNVALGACLATAALTAASAIAAAPEFTALPSVKTYEETVGPGLFTANNGVDKIACEKGTATGTITGMRTFGKVVFKLKECKSTGEAGSNCTIKTTGAGAGEIVSLTLKGELGTVKSSEATTEVGVLAEPETGTTWLTLSGNACTETTKVTGRIAGEVGPIKTFTTKGFINFEVVSEKQKIKKIGLLSGLVEPKMSAFSTSVAEEKDEVLESKEPMEID